MENDAATTPLPKKQLLALSIILFSEPMTMTSVFPYIYFMVRDFHIANHSNDIGYYLGLLTSAYFVARIGALFWGSLSDRWGRKPILICGLVANLVCMLWYGCSTTFWTAVAARFCCGLLNGNLGVGMSVMSELTDPSNEAKGYSLFGIIFGVGTLVAPLVGGFFSNPVEHFPQFFGKVSVLAMYPYLLPNVLCALVSLVGLFSAFFLLEETLAVENNQGKSQSQLSISSGNSFEGNSETSENRVWTSCFDQLRTFDRNACIAIGLYSIHMLFQVMNDELFPLWCVTSVEQGGLHFNQQNIATAMTLAGCFALFHQILIFPKIHNRFGSLSSYEGSMAIYILVFLAQPFFNLLQPASGVLLWSALLVSLFLRTLAMTTAYTSAMILVSSSTEDSRRLGLLHGSTQFVATTLAASGPWVIGGLWSWSLRNQQPHILSFLLLIAFAILCIILVHMARK